MSFDRSVRYPTKWLPPSPSFPFGVPKNSTTETSKDGVPFEKDFISDTEGFFQGLLSRRNITLSGNPDTALISDYLNALGFMVGITHATVSDVVDDETLKAGMQISTADKIAANRGGGANYLVKTDAQASADGDVVPSDDNFESVITGLVIILQSVYGAESDTTIAHEFDTVALMKASLITFPDGKTLEWGYYAKGDTGSNTGIVKTGAHTEDDGSIFTLADGKYVEAIFESYDVKIEYFGVGAGLDPSINDPAFAKARVYATTNFFVTLTIGEGAYLFEESMDFKNMPHAGFVGAGIEKTVINCGATLTVPFLDLGQRIAEVNNSNISGGRIGNFTIKVFGVNSAIGASFANFNRGRILDMAIDGFDENFSIAYMWLTAIGKIICRNHVLVGSHFHGGQVNAIIVEHLSATTAVTSAKNHVFEEMLSLSIGSLTSEGGALISLEFKDVIGLTVDNYHQEGPGLIQNQSGEEPMAVAGSIAINSANMWGSKAQVFFILSAASQGMIALRDISLSETDFELSSLQLRLGCRDLVIDNMSVTSTDSDTIFVGPEDLSNFITTSVTNLAINGRDPRFSYDRVIAAVASTPAPTTFKVEAQTSYIINVSFRNTSSNRAVAKFRLDMFDTTASFGVTVIDSSVGFNDPSVVAGFVNIEATSTIDVDVTINKL